MRKGIWVFSLAMVFSVNICACGQRDEQTAVMQKIISSDIEEDEEATEDALEEIEAAKVTKDTESSRGIEASREATLSTGTGKRQKTENFSSGEKCTPHKHIFVDRIISERDCIRAEKVESACSVCGVSGGVEITAPALGHELYEEWFIMPDCENVGWKTDKCSRCDYAFSHEGKPLGHEWEEIDSGPGDDCKTSGYITQVCKNCGDAGSVWENGRYGQHDYEVYSYDEIVIEEAAPEGGRIKKIHREGIRCAACGREHGEG